MAIKLEKKQRNIEILFKLNKTADNRFLFLKNRFIYNMIFYIISLKQKNRQNRIQIEEFVQETI